MCRARRLSSPYSLIIYINKSRVVMTYPHPSYPAVPTAHPLFVDLDQSEACLVHSVKWSGGQYG